MVDFEDFSGKVFLQVLFYRSFCSRSRPKGALVHTLGDFERNESAPFDMTTKYSVNFSWSTHMHSNKGYEYHDGSEMTIRVETPEYQEEQEQQEDQMRKELGC